MKAARAIAYVVMAVIAALAGVAIVDIARQVSGLPDFNAWMEAASITLLMLALEILSAKTLEVTA